MPDPMYPPPPPIPPFAHSPSAQFGGRCHLCGYSLTGLPVEGRCPECGSPYTPESAHRLQPWPKASTICWRLGWPLLAMAVVMSLAVSSAGNTGVVFGILAYPLLLAVPVNSYFQVRSMLKRSMPETRRTSGVVALLRGVGTTACVVVLLFLLLPFILFAACLLTSQKVNFH